MGTIEDPRVLLGRLKLGREEYCQRLLTMLILDGPYPRWNSRSTPSPDGLRFLSLLELLSFGEPGPWSEPVFIDELDLPRRHEWEQGGAPDQCLLDEHRLWLIELKTEAGSHRPGQIPNYFELGRHHYPSHRIDITYLTGPLSKPAPPVPDGSRYAHLTWHEVLELVHDVWLDRSPTHRDVVRALDDVLGGSGTSWPMWRTTSLASGVTAEPASPFDPIQNALALARRTADDHQQRALDYAPESLEELQTLRLDALRAIKDTGEPSLSHVRPWLWRWESGGQPLTDAGRESGYELRLSWYTKPVT